MNTGAPQDLTGQSIDDGRYVIQKPLGAGGMGAVWMATASRMKTDVVIKFPHEVMLNEEGFKERFQNEVGSLINLSHRHQSIVKILDVGEHNGLPYAVMQYLSGGSLKTWRKRLQSVRGRKPVNWQRALRWIEEIADALDYVHANALIHRDVKPQNILFDDAGKAYLADFGIAKIVSENSPVSLIREITQTNQVVGTLGYMAYELLLGQPIDGRVDQFALGVTVYEMLGGARPFQGTTPAAICVEQQQNQPKPVHEMAGDLPAALSPVLAQALHVEREQRFENCATFASAVIAAFGGSSPSRSQGDAPSVVEAEVVTPPPAPRQATSPTARVASDHVETTSEEQEAQRKPASGTARQAQPAAVPEQVSQAVNRADLFPPGAAPQGGSPTPPSVPTAIPVTPPSGTPSARSSPVHSPTPATPTPPTGAAGRVKRILCPWCWYRFAPSDLLWIAEHADLVGDIVLGEDESHRFLPEVYTAQCRALDAMGTVCHRTACPRCHLVVPRELVDYEPLIVSLLGIPTAGKTCFLAAMSWQLRRTMRMQFQFGFTDADSEMNQRLIQHEQMLFMNSRDDLVRLQKTDLVGDGYRQLQMAGQQVNLLQPTVFGLRPTAEHPNHHAARQISFALCLYDNAGEHFLPGQDAAHQPITGHLGASEAVLFLFDPSQHPRFREACEGSTSDPQFARGFYPHTIRQETVLNEALQRIRRQSTMSLHEKYDKPLVVLLNKYDAWAPRFEGKRLSEPWVKGKPGYPASINTRRVAEISDRMRKIMLKYCPEVVSAAEDFSTDVTYMPVSSFGRRVETSGGNDVTGVRANQLRPMWTEVPLLYILSRIRKGVVPQA